MRRIQKLLGAERDYVHRLWSRTKAGPRRTAHTRVETALIKILRSDTGVPFAIARSQPGLSVSDLIAILHQGDQYARRENLPAQSWNEDGPPRGVCQ